MNETGLPSPEINLILAADHRCGEINPQDDHIWEVSTTRGEPPGIALQTTYGLRAYGMRVFPRFIYNKMPISDPHAFAVRPTVEFRAPNFLSLIYSPFHSIDVLQKVWVPDSHTLVGQVTITNNGASMLQFGLEWVVLLNPLLSGSPMASMQFSVNTILQGQTQHLYPVFFMTGGPQDNMSAFPSLGMELTLTPHASRQFSWALSTLDSMDASFYNARKSTAYSLDNEQIKIGMQQKQNNIDFDFGDSHWNGLLQDCQHRIFQLIIPPGRNFLHPSYVMSRLPDQGFNPAEKGKEFALGWGVLRLPEIMGASRILLPMKPDLVKGFLQNLLDQQGDDGTVFALTGWNGNITRLPAIPMITTLVLELHDQGIDLKWLSQIYPALVRSIKVWLDANQDQDGDGIPEWGHLLQTGITDSVMIDPQLKTDLTILIQAAEWPSLAALLIQECQGLIKIASWIGDPSEIDWLQEQIQRLQSFLAECWDAKRSFYCFRDKESHITHPRKVLHTFKQDGTANLTGSIANHCRLCVKLHPRDGSMRTVECLIKGVVNHHEKTIKISGKHFQWEDDNAIAVTDEIFTNVKQITIHGLKKGDRLTVEIPDLMLMGPDFMIPLWAGIPTTEQAGSMVQSGIKYLDAPNVKIPQFLKIIWIEGLIKYNFRQLACEYYQKWFLEDLTGSDSSANHGNGNLSRASLQDLPPITTLLQLLGIQNLSEEELLLSGFNEFFPKVNVQYKKFHLVLESAQVKVQDLNGESVLITEPGTHRIILT